MLVYIFIIETKYTVNGCGAPMSIISTIDSSFDMIVDAFHGFFYVVF